MEMLQSLNLKLHMDADCDMNHKGHFFELNHQHMLLAKCPENSVSI